MFGLLRSLKRGYAAISVNSGNSYRPRKQLTWSQCQDYLRKPVVLFLQLDNLDTQSRLSLKTKMAAMGLSIKTPKAHILRKVIQNSVVSNLEGIVVGFTGLAISNKAPHELQSALQFLNSQPRVLILGGKIDSHSFSPEGIRDVVFNVAPIAQLTTTLVGLLSSPAQALVSAMQRAPMTLVSALEQYKDLLEKPALVQESEKSGIDKTLEGGLFRTVRLATGRRHRMESLLRLDDNFDIILLDRVVSAFYQGHGQEHTTAQKVITQLQEHPDAWQKVDYILENSKNMNTKYIALQILEKLIQTRWNALPREQCEGIKNYIVTLVIRSSSDENTLKQERVLLNKLNLILVQVLKQEWPKNWPTFISELVASSRTSLSLCENNMTILKLLSEEVFDYSAEQMTTIKAKNLKTQLCGEFAQVFQLCTEVLEKAQKPSLILATLEALLRFLKWIPLGYIFETTLIDNLRTRFLTVPTFRNVTLKCLTEICALTIGSEYDVKFVHLFQSVMDSLGLMIQYSRDLDLARAYQNSSDEEQKLIQNLAIFFSTCLGNHLKVLEAHVNRELLLLAHMYLLKISLVDDREVFKVCLEYWTKLVSDLYNEYPFAAMESSNLFLGSIVHTNSRRAMYGEVLSSLRLVMIDRMVKPEEVLIVEDENGEIVREQIKETDTITLYKSMREVLVYLTHLDYEDTENIMTEKLARQFDGSEWSWNNLNKLCWAIGSISGAMNEEVEKRFLVNIIRDLLGLTEMKRGKDNKAVVASNIMYIVGQYPRFLKAHWKFLKTVVNKLFEFMHELHEGVQDMACDTFIKISKKCRRHFVVLQPGEAMPFVDEILAKLPSIICDLQPGQVHTFYEAIGYMIQSQTEATAQAAEIGQLMALPNGSWDTVIAAAAHNVDILKNTETLKSLSNILRSNIYACEAIGPAFSAQISRIYMDMLSLYRAVSGIISDAVATQGVIATKTPVVRAMRAVKKDILRLAETFIGKSEDLSAVAQSFTPPLLDAILGDYSRNVEQARDSEVLSVTAATINKLAAHMEDKVLPILSAVFECTLNMINKDFSEYPEHRVHFFKLLSAINSHCFIALLRLPPPQFKLIVDSILWAIKHTHRDIADTGLAMLLQLLQNMSQADSATSAQFYREYFLGLLQDIFYTLTDTDHKAGFKYQTAILAHMFQVITNGTVKAAIYDISKFPDTNNSTYLQSHMLGLLTSAFPHLQKAQIETFIRGLFDLNQDMTTFKAHLRDFLISLKEFAGDNQELYLEELELEQERKRKAEMEAAMKIPGLVKPMDRPDDLSD